MRLYLIHRRYYKLYLRAQERVEKILNEQEEIFQKVEPKSSLAEHERDYLPNNPSTGGKGLSRKAEEYAIEMERRRIKERLSEAMDILADRRTLMLQKEEELRKSKDIYNMIYTLRWVDGMKPDAIVEATGYSRSQVYSITKQIQRQIERS